MSVYSVDKLMSQTRKLAADYRRATGQPLPVTTEIANFDAATLLDLELVQPPPGGHDAVGRSGEREGVRYQIKGRAIFADSKGGHRIGQLKLEKEWDAVLLVLLDDEFEPFEIYEADRDTIVEAMEEGAASKRSKRGAMSVARFKNISRLVWTREEGEIKDELWDNRRG
ncbi:MAG: hypothetical protein ACQETD_12305 [Pseudomonadota bacterium]